MDVEDIIGNVVSFVDYQDRNLLRRVASKWRESVDTALLEINDVSDLDLADIHPQAELILTNLNSDFYQEYQSRAIEIHTNSPELLLPQLPKLKALTITRGHVTQLNYDLEICHISNSKVSVSSINAGDVILTNCKLRQLPNLNCTYLDCSGNSISEVNVPELVGLNCQGNNITSINLPDLIELNISNNPTREIVAPNLEALNCDNCRVVTFDTPSLRTLSCRGNGFTKLDLSSELRYLDCRNNSLESLDCRNLETLKIDNNPLETLNLNRLKTLTCRNTNLASLPNSDYLEELSCECEIGFYPNLRVLAAPKWRVEQARELYRSHNSEHLLDESYTRSSLNF